ncbi:MAG: UDP-N-acetylmuramoyl-L-alanine--D-glutamate ligase [Candidatus Pacebacteria bacterium]|nr:UDP-N-acetylmuramoyl-L-alanine--D-glutamate ligase [Candidatus Paceibacterota bacterium]
MKIEDFKNKKVTIFGLGVMGGGVGTAKFLSKSGARVTVTDIKTETDLAESVDSLKKQKIDFILGKHRREDFTNVDFVIKGPGIPNNSQYLEIARKNKVPIETDIGIFFELCKAPIIGVTGSKGKSTTAVLIQKILKTKFKNVILGGNIGVSVLDILGKIKKDTIVVLELSSWQLEGLLPHKKSPHIAVITNIFPEHLNRYRDFKDYVDAKKIIFKFQKENDYLILNENLKEFFPQVKSKIVFFKGGNNEAAKAVSAIYNINSRKIEEVINNFESLEGRLEFVEEIDGIKFYNDTCATHPNATIYSMEKLKEKEPLGNIILIAGGEDKNLNFEQFTRFIKKEIKTLILLPGSASNKIKSEVSTIKVENIEEAVREAKKEAQSGDIVLLSPAAASFNLFKNEFDRGRKFKEAIKTIT